jgi:ACS family hexuronate transporter-like MFS transporter
MAGVLLGVLLWKYVLFIYAAPAMIMSVFVWWSLRDVGREGGQEQIRRLGIQFRDYLMLLKDPVVLGLVLAASLRGVGLFALFNWTPFYLKDVDDGLGMSHFRAGFHYALLTGMGIVSAPVLGVLSDKFGRKMVLVPGLIFAAILSMLVVSAGDSFLLALVLAGAGLFSFALHQIIQAALLDVVGRGMEATATGLLFGLNGVFGGASPFLASVIIDHLGGLGSIYYYSGILTAIAAVIVMVIPLQRRETAASGRV